MKNLVLFGMQGSGKGTQGKRIAEQYGYRIFETGAELRKLTAEDSELGRKVKAIVDAGNLVPNEIVMEIIENFLLHTPKDAPVLFDGIPRSMPQKITFDELLQRLQRPLMGIFIEMTEEEAMERLVERGRSDDNETAIKRRIENYRNETIPVIEDYEQEGMLRRVNGLQTIEDVFADVCVLLDDAMAQDTAVEEA